jgi:hypothetical protein
LWPPNLAAAAAKLRGKNRITKTNNIISNIIYIKVQIINNDIFIFIKEK